VPEQTSESLTDPFEGAGRGGGDSAGERSDRPRRVVRMVVLAALVVIACGINLGHMWRYTEVSPIDEAQHLDSLIRIPRGDLIGSGERMGQETLHIETCHRIDSAFDAAVPPCTPDDVELDATTFQEEGYNTAYIHPPTFYVVDGLVARVIDAVLPGEHDLLTTGRLAGLMWVISGVVFMWLLLDEIGSGLVARSSLILIAVTAPTVLHGSATVNLDATALTAGAAVFWAILRWERGRARAWLPLALTGLAAATKVTNLMGVLVVLVYLVVRAIVLTEAVEGSPWWSWSGLRGRFLDGGSAARRLLSLVAGMIGVIALISMVWFVAQKMLEVAPPSTIPMVYRYHFARFPFTEMAAAWHQTVSPFVEHYVPPFLRSRTVLTMAGIVDLLVVAGPVAGTIMARRGSRERSLGVSVLIVMPLIGPLLVLFNALVQSLYVVIPSRYGLSIVPALLAASVPAMRRRVPLVIGSVAAVLALYGVVACIVWPAA
jgi:hypothetical protein